MAHLTAHLFLSTLSLRRATAQRLLLKTQHPYFYPRSPCGERLYPSQWRTLARDFYPRSPCGERRCNRLHPSPAGIHFYPRSPCGERLELAFLAINPITFLSTLSLRRATSYGRTAKMVRPNFYPRSPCGERLVQRGPWPHQRGHFYPRSPCGERPSVLPD